MSAEQSTSLPEEDHTLPDVEHMPPEPLPTAEELPSATTEEDKLSLDTADVSYTLEEPELEWFLLAVVPLLTRDAPPYTDLVPSELEDLLTPEESPSSSELDASEPLDTNKDVLLLPKLEPTEPDLTLSAELSTSDLSELDSTDRESRDSDATTDVPLSASRED